MERKRKLPARAAARAEQAAKRRTMTPPQRSITPAPAPEPEPEPTPVEEAPTPLPKSVTAGKPLPTIDSPQPEDLSFSEYQSVTESGVLAESLLRSRQKWTTEGIFEKYWTKPIRKRGVVFEEPNNPPKETMTKIGQVTITVEPHVFEAIMYAVKEPKPPVPTPPPTERPIIQYGPPNGGPQFTPRPQGLAPNGTTPSTGPPAKGAPGTDPIILTLAEKAGTDPQLRDLMKRVAQGEATKPELERFQAIIDAITAESKRNGSTSGPSADRLLVDGKTVRYFADEVRAILDIVLSSNPKQTSADLRPPVGSDTLVVMLVKAALDDLRTREMVRRIAENKPFFADATDLKVILDRLRSKMVKDKEPQQATQPPQVIASFLLVRKGSKAEYPMADPELDYYQPLTIRLFTHAGRHLENLARVVAPPDEVTRYMDDVMGKMTRADVDVVEAGKKQQQQQQPGVLWTTKTVKAQVKEVPTRGRGFGKVMDADEQYQSFIASVSRKEV
ncbi:hypothetical protein N0V88_005532 [Collariella sp. IMI 366227]|nr:hypothetical protein N0V88_005532 [Collariella sp. IMI 366227]